MRIAWQVTVGSALVVLGALEAQQREPRRIAAAPRSTRVR
jgi:hypothetical protein